MAFVSAITFQGVRGSKKISKGTYTNGGADTGGDINTGLVVCEHITLTPKGSAVNANAPVVNETLPMAGSAITIVTDADADGIWEAEGY